MKHNIYMLLLLLLMTGCNDKKKHKETISPNQVEFFSEETSVSEPLTLWRDVESDTICCDDGTIIHWHEQHHNSPFHRLTEMYRPTNRLIAQTALQDGRATDQILLYEYDKNNKLQCIHNFCSYEYTENLDELTGLKRMIDSLYLHIGHPVYNDEWNYIDYHVSYDKQGLQSGMFSNILDREIDKNVFGSHDIYEVKALENTDFWISDLHGGTLLVCQLWDAKNGNTENYTGIRALAVNLKKIWCKEYKDGELVKVTFFHPINSCNEEKTHTIEYQKQADGSVLYTIKDKDDVTTEYIWKSGLPVKCTKTSKYNTILYKADFSVVNTDVQINESIYNYRLKKLEKQPVKHQPYTRYDEGLMMDISRMIWDEYDSGILPPDVFLK